MHPAQNVDACFCIYGAEVGVLVECMESMASKVSFSAFVVTKEVMILSSKKYPGLLAHQQSS